jgi:hypothetical protein
MEEARWCPRANTRLFAGLYLGEKPPIKDPTPVPATVLIAPPAHLPALQALDGLSGALAFSDKEALRALDVITNHRPTLIAIDQLFAASSRGSALIDRIKADPTLTSCEIRIVVLEPSDTANDEATAAANVAPIEPHVAPCTMLDHEGTRRSPRFAIVEGIELLIDGNGAALRDLSLSGAMVTSLAPLRPNQRVRLSLPDPKRPVRFNAVVAWARFELFNGAPRYRAGLEFVDAEPQGVQRFIDAHAVERFIAAAKRAG